MRWRGSRRGSGDPRRWEVHARPAGRVAAVGVALLLTGLAAVGPPLIVTGAGLAILALLSLALAVTVTAGATVSVLATPAAVLDGDRLQLEFIIRTSALLRVPAATIEHALLPAPLPVAAGRRQSGHRLSVVIETRVAGRGPLDLDHARLRYRDPLGLVQAVRPGSGPLPEVLVLPRLSPVHWRTPASLSLNNPAGEVPSRSEAFDLVGLRDYQPGTPVTRIHWPALARSGVLLERVFATDVGGPPIVMVDPHGRSSDGSREPVDAIISAAASLTLALARQDRVELMLGGHSAPLDLGRALTAWPAVHRAFARLPQLPPDAPPLALPPQQARLLIYACADPEQARLARRRWDGRLLMLVPAGSVRAPEAIFEVSGCLAVELTR